MGHDVYNVRRHNLNTSSIEGLAEDLSKRLKANVEYGYYDTFFFDWDGFYREASYNFLKFGVIKFPGAHTERFLTIHFMITILVLMGDGADFA